jgi:gamma-glutamylcyclotransferase (GGCT)/AIG2-like uncharacterized protein YtfP
MDITRCFEGAAFVREDRVSGMLYKVGGFPGAQLIGDVFDSEVPDITGDVFEVKDAAMAQALDRYEGHPDFFIRRQVFTESGLQVWVYEYPKQMPLESLIPMGDWLASLEIPNEINVGG